MPLFRRKPVVVEARQLTINNIYELERWSEGSIKGTALPIEQRCIDIQTNSGEQRADMGDWIIIGSTGEFHPCKPDIFELVYEKI